MSVFTAELVAIFFCLQSLTEALPKYDFILLTDSLTSLQAHFDPYSNHSIIQRIFLDLSSSFLTNTPITFLWTPSQVAVVGNDSGDPFGKTATTLLKITNSLWTPDYDLNNYADEQFETFGNLLRRE